MLPAAVIGPPANWNFLMLSSKANGLMTVALVCPKVVVVYRPSVLFRFQPTTRSSASALVPGMAMLQENGPALEGVPESPAPRSRSATTATAAQTSDRVGVVGERQPADLADAVVADVMVMGVGGVDVEVLLGTLGHVPLRVKVDMLAAVLVLEPQAAEVLGVLAAVAVRLDSSLRLVGRQRERRHLGCVVDAAQDHSAGRDLRPGSRRRPPGRRGAG